jgi:hypothetical protein
MESLLPQPWQKRLGVRPGNPIGTLTLFAIAFTLIGTLALVIALFALPTTTQKLNAGYVLLFFSSLLPIPAGLLTLWSRNIARAQDAALNNAWAHWRYSPRDKYADFLPKHVDEVYIHASGVYFPALKLRPRSFSSGLTDAQIYAGSPATLVLSYAFKHRSKYGYVYHQQTKQITLPIPKGKEAEAEALVERFKRERIGIPSDFMNDSWAVGWIMGGGILVAVLFSTVLVLPLDFQKHREELDAVSTAAAERRATETYTLSAQFAPIQPVLEDQLEGWREESRQRGVGQWQSIPGDELGFEASDNLTRVVYGHCEKDGEFYLFAIEKTPSKSTYYRDFGGALAFTTGDLYYTCSPELLKVSSVTHLSDGWYYVTLEAQPITPTQDR